MDKYIVALIVSIIAGVVTYIVQYYSVLSPCMVEFDGDSDKEMLIMNRYNEIFDYLFRYHMLVVIAVWAFVMFTEHVPCMIYIIAFQLVYIVGVTAAMAVMYIRSRIYWSMRAEKIKREGMKDDAYIYSSDMDNCSCEHYKVS